MLPPLKATDLVSFVGSLTLSILIAVVAIVLYYFAHSLSDRQVQDSAHYHR